MNRATADFDAVLERLGDGVHRPAERGQERRVGIYDASAIRADELWNQDFIEARQDNKANLTHLQSFQEPCLPLRPLWDRRAIYQAHGYAG
jgi:hypothetical protein